MKIRELPNWPPEPGGAYGKVEILSASPDEAVVSTFYRTFGGWVTFGCTFGGKEHSYDFSADNEEIAGEVADAIKNRIGKTLKEVGEVKIKS